MNALLDSSVLIDLLRGHIGAEAEIEKLRLNGAVFYTSTLNLYEVLCGLTLVSKRHPNRMNAFETMVSSIHVLDFNPSCAKKSAQIFAQLRAAGKPADGLDYLVAGTALSSGIDVIVSANKKHFEHIDGLKVIGY